MHTTVSRFVRDAGFVCVDRVLHVDVRVCFCAVIVHDCKDFLQDRKVIRENLFRHVEIDVNRGVRFSTSL